MRTRSPPRAATTAPIGRCASPSASSSRPTAATAAVDHEHEADAAVEGAPHLLARHRAFALQPVEHRRRHRCLDFHAEAVGHDADDVLGQAAAGDVGQGVDGVAVVAAQQLEHRLHVQRGGRHQRVHHANRLLQVAGRPARS